MLVHDAVLDAPFQRRENSAIMPVDNAHGTLRGASARFACRMFRLNFEEFFAFPIRAGLIYPPPSIVRIVAFV